MNAKQEKLVSKLKELFQMDQAELDFGIYRIMNAKHEEIDAFLNHDLIPTIRETLESKGRLKDIQSKLDEAIAGVKDLGVDPEAVPKVQELRDLLGGNSSSVEREQEDVFSHLYTFFSRYYDGGDFMSLRRYKKKTFSPPPLPMNG